MLLLDEIAGGLTDSECQDLIAAIRAVHAAGVSIIWIEHVVHALVAVVGRLVVHHRPRAVEGEPHAVMASRRCRRSISGIEAEADGLLAIGKLDAFYGDFQALFGVVLRIEKGETVAIIGANGAGKSTLLRIDRRPASAPAPSAIRFAGEAIGALAPRRIVARGIALVPEGRRLFPSLSVEENLPVGRPSGRGPVDAASASIDCFRCSREGARNPATALSGGQQQMVAIGRALMANRDLAAVRRDQPRPRADRHPRHLRGAPRHPRRGRRRSSSSRTPTARSPWPTASIACREAASRSRASPRNLTRDAISSAYFGA